MLWILSLFAVFFRVLGVEGRGSLIHGWISQASTIVSKTFQIQLHTGVPGPVGTEHVAAENAKKNVTLESALEAANAVSTTAPEWAGVKANETYAYFSLWKEGGGAFMGYGQFTVPITVEIGDTFKINAGQLTVTPE